MFDDVSLAAETSANAPYPAIWSYLDLAKALETWKCALCRITSNGGVSSERTKDFRSGLAMLAMAAAVTAISAVPAQAAAVQATISYKRVTNYHSELVMAVNDASTANNAQAIQTDFTVGPPYNDVMGLERQTPDSNWYRIKPEHSGKCLAVVGASMANNAGILQAPCTYDSLMNDVWLLEQHDIPVPGGVLIGAFQFRNLNSGKCILVNGASFIAGANLLQFTCGANESGYWTGIL